MKISHTIANGMLILTA